MTNPLLETGIAALQKKMTRNQCEIFLAELLSIEQGSVSWCESEENKSACHAILRSRISVFRSSVGTSENADAAASLISSHFGFARLENVDVSIRLPSFAFTSWIRVDACRFEEFLSRFLLHESAVVFLLDVDGKKYVIGNQDGDLDVYCERRDARVWTD